MAIGITILEQHPEGPRNTLLLLDRHGECVLSYAKVHTCDFGDECCLTPGEGFHTADLDTEAGAVRVGAMICYDREFPESARILMLMGAEIVLVPNACPMEINRLSQLRGRAYENMLESPPAIIPRGSRTATATHQRLTAWRICRGRRDREICVFWKPMEKRGFGWRNLIWSFCGHTAVRRYHGNAYRRPELYGLLTEDTVRPPFVRKDRRKPVL